MGRAHGEIVATAAMVDDGKRLDVKGAADRAGARVPRRFVALWEAESGRTA